MKLYVGIEKFPGAGGSLFFYKRRSLWPTFILQI